jgi:hypothetical protein
LGRQIWGVADGQCHSFSLNDHPERGDSWTGKVRTEGPALRRDIALIGWLREIH